MSDPLQRPALVVYGNCQAGFITEVLQRVQALAAAYEIVWIRNIRDPDGGFRVDTGVVARTAVLLEQTGNFGNDGILRADGQLRLAFPETCRRIRFPPLFMTSLWPFVAIDPRNQATILPAQAEGAYPNFLANRLIMQLMADDPAPDAVFDRFMATRIRDTVDLDRLHRLSLSKLRKLDQESDVTIGDIVEAGFTRERLFVMQLHPTGAMFARLLRRLLDALGTPHTPDTTRLLDAIARWPGIGNYDAPIHPQIAEHFGLQWADGVRYRYFEEGSFDFESCIRRYIAFEHIREFAFAAELERLGDLVHAEAALRRGIEHHPKIAALHLRLGLLLEKQDRLGEAAQALSRATRLRHDGARFHRHLARVLRRTGALPIAYASAATAVALDGERLESVVELAETLAALGRADEAAAAHRQADALRACFGDPPLDLEVPV
jgi:tetratricopeptide (TPR) repeat protein